MPPLIGISESIEKIRRLINRLADNDLNVLIVGESGVGKEVVVQNLIHESRRKDKPLIKINCTALPESLVESELFGFEKGAFTGAERRKRGKFELADEGVIFLDEIGDMSLTLQSKLLHVLQSGEYSPLGSEKELKSNAWIITATNQELEKKVKEGLFREDLYYRLNSIKIYIPPLRHRPEDIPPLMDYYLKEYSSELDGNWIPKPDSDDMEKLKKHSWPGNVRELQNIIRSCLVMGNWEEIIGNLHIKDKPYVSSTFEQKGTSDQKVLDKPLDVDTILDLIKENSTGDGSFSLKEIRKEAMDAIDKKVISHVLNQTGWNRKKASKILKISYQAILYKINDLDIVSSTPDH